jgi:hypothetical protein
VLLVGTIVGFLDGWMCFYVVLLFNFEMDGSMDMLKGGTVAGF